MKAPDYWKSHYVTVSDPDVIEGKLRHEPFVSAGQRLELLHFPAGGKSAVLISQGSGGHPYVFAEVAFAVHLLGHDVFVMPKHGDAPVAELLDRHTDALVHIQTRLGCSVVVFGEGLGGYVAFYLALAHAPMARLICQNSPAILTEPAYRRALLTDRGPWRRAARRRRLMMPLVPVLERWAPGLKIPIWSYLPWRDLVDRGAAREIERRLVVDGYLKDPDFDRWYPLRAVASLLTTRSPGRVRDLITPIMFIVATDGPTPEYIADLYTRLPDIPRKLVRVEGSVYWMISHPYQAADLIGGWINETDKGVDRG